ncbi:MAG: hypothetical protein KDN18_25025 [Verrucomicrobiae bacterium]|nr:hypothetical protein [Verrucomicrobiae bacterium]
MIAPFRLTLAFLFAAVLPLAAQDSWQDDLRNYHGTVPLVAPQGYRVVAKPSPDATSIVRVAGPVTLGVVGFVEAGGQRFYLSEEANRKWIETGEDPAWFTAGGSEQLPALPRLVHTGEGEDPDSGEPVTIAVHEETVAVAAESRWPVKAAAPAEGEVRKFFPAAVIAAAPGTVDFQLFPNGDAPTFGYPFAEPSFRELTSGKPAPLIRLASRPDRDVFRLVIEADSLPLSLFQPGLVYLAAFKDGRLVELSTGGDAWGELSPVSRLGAPVFHRADVLEFAFPATLVNGGETLLKVKPGLIVGADYTNYGLIAQMGAPFDEYAPAEFQSGWTLTISSEGKTTLAAPLYDGRGAPGMIELEGLSLDAAPPTAAAVYTPEQFKAFRGALPGKLDPAAVGDGWKTILATKLGDIPAAQRGPETDGSRF